MRTREEIEKVVQNKANYQEFDLEVLMDIRGMLVELLELLKKKK